MREELKNAYVDLDLRFTAHPVSGDVTRKRGVDALLQSIRNLVLTAEGEFVGELDVGGGAYRLLFKNNDPLLAYTLQDRISKVIEDHEPRVRLKEVLVNNTSDRASVFVTVRFYALDQENPFSAEIQLSRIR